MKLEQQISRLWQAVELLAAAMAGLSEKAFLSKLNGWSPRDIVAHLIGWNRHVIHGSEQIQKGELPFYDMDPGEDYSKVNEALILQYDSTDRQAILEELRVSAGELRGFLESLDPEVWSRDFGVRHGGTRVTIRDTIDELIEDYIHHSLQVENFIRTQD